MAKRIKRAISVTLDPQLLAFIEAEAKRSDLSTSAWINRALWQKCKRLMVTRKWLPNPADEDVAAELLRKQGGSPNARD